MQLNPPELGRVDVDLRVEGEQIRISVRTETVAARDLIHQRAALLTAALEKHGIHVDLFDVVVEDRADDAADTDDGERSPVTTPRGQDQTSRQSGGQGEKGAIEEVDQPIGLERETDEQVAAETRLDVRV